MNRLQRGMLSTLIPILVLLLPSRIKVGAFRALLGWDIAPTARIGFSLVAASHLAMAERARIGHLSVIRDVRVRMEAFSTIGNWNWISAAPALRASDKLSDVPLVSLGAHSAITSRHYIDGSGDVMIGSFTTMAGVRSTILTHQIDLDLSLQSVRSVTIGDYCFISSNVSIVPGARIGDKSVVAMGAVVVGLLEGGMLYAGVPATAIPTKPSDGAYFRRHRGEVGTISEQKIWDRRP